MICPMAYLKFATTILVLVYLGEKESSVVDSVKKIFSSGQSGQDSMRAYS